MKKKTEDAEMDIQFYLEPEDIKDRGAHTVIGHPSIKITTKAEPQSVMAKVEHAVLKAGSRRD